MKEGRELQETLVQAARESLEAARVMAQNRWYGFAASISASSRVRLPM